MRSCGRQISDMEPNFILKNIVVLGQFYLLIKYNVKYNHKNKICFTCSSLRFPEAPSRTASQLRPLPTVLCEKRLEKLGRAFVASHSVRLVWLGPSPARCMARSIVKTGLRNSMALPRNHAPLSKRN